MGQRRLRSLEGGIAPNVGRRGDQEKVLGMLGDETLKKIAQELTESLRKNITVDWSQRESIRAKLRIMVKRILRKYKYPPDQATICFAVFGLVWMWPNWVYWKKRRVLFS